MSSERKKVNRKLPMKRNEDGQAGESYEELGTAVREGQSIAGAFLRSTRQDPGAATDLNVIAHQLRTSKSAAHMIGFLDVLDQHVRATIGSPDIDMLLHY